MEGLGDQECITPRHYKGLLQVGIEFEEFSDESSRLHLCRIGDDRGRNTKVHVSGWGASPQTFISDVISIYQFLRSTKLKYMSNEKSITVAEKVRQSYFGTYA